MIDEHGDFVCEIGDYPDDCETVCEDNSCSCHPDY
jgi:hypothetical protein